MLLRANDRTHGERRAVDGIPALAVHNDLPIVKAHAFYTRPHNEDLDGALLDQLRVQTHRALVFERRTVAGVNSVIPIGRTRSRQAWSL